MHIYRGYWAIDCFHTIWADSIEDAFEQFIKWGKEHWWCMNNPSDVVVVQIA